MLSKEFFVGNRRRLRGLLGDGLIIVTANGLLQRSGDTTYEFRQDSNFFYLTGLNEPDLVLIIHGSEEFIILPKRSQTEDIFGGSINCDEIAKSSGIKRILAEKEGWLSVKKLRHSRKIVKTLFASSAKIIDTDSFYTNPARRRLLQKLKRYDFSLEDIRMDLVQLRQIKQPEEVKAIQRAIEITNQGFQSVKNLIQAGVHEYELEAEFDKIFKQNQTRHSYQPIIASEKNATTLHYIKNNAKLKSNELILFDVGAEYQNYAADISRTYVVNEMSARQNDVFQAVKTVQDQAIELLKPSLEFKSYVQRVEEIMGEELIKLGLIKESKQEEIRKYFPHAIGHSLGLDVHDVCEYKTIQEDMVLTVEPGIYIPEEGIGIRIEDDILITKNGTKNLSQQISYQ